jgi:hypothetical protein
VIIVKGECAGAPGVVFINNKNGLTLEGQTGDGLDALLGSVNVFEARNITLRNLTVKQASDDGIIVSGAGTVYLDTVTVSDNRGRGVGVFDHSFLSMSRSTVTKNDEQGINAVGGSRVTVFGSDITENKLEGINLFHDVSLSVGRLRGGGGLPARTSKINDNEREGIRAQLGSSVFVSGIGSAKIEIKNNGKDGDREGLDLSASKAHIDDVIIEGNYGRPVVAFDGSVLRAFDSTIHSDVPDDGLSTGGMLFARGSILTLGGRNTITNDAAAPGGTAISISNASQFQSSRIGTRPKDVISSTNGRALSVSRKSLGDLRNFELNGFTQVLNQSSLRLRKDTSADVNGDIEVSRDSAISFLLTPLPEGGSVKVTGTVTCTDTESSADLAGQTAADIVGGNGKKLKCSGYGPANSKP